jgi:hypothetical protein
MTKKNDLKIYLASIGAVQVAPGIICAEQKQGFISCEVERIVKPPGVFAVAFVHHPRLLVKYEEAEATEYALSEARRLFPEEKGWIGHYVALKEIPRLMFVEMQLFTTAREFLHRLLLLTGFRK